MIVTPLQCAWYWEIHWLIALAWAVEPSPFKVPLPQVIPAVVASPCVLEDPLEELLLFEAGAGAELAVVLLFVPQAASVRPAATSAGRRPWRRNFTGIPFQACVGSRPGRNLGRSGESIHGRR